MDALLTQLADLPKPQMYALPVLPSEPTDAPLLLVDLPNKCALVVSLSEPLDALLDQVPPQLADLPKFKVYALAELPLAPMDALLTQLADLLKVSALAVLP